jgi:riboflavin biosynthesis pyrimidine reductase
VALEDLLTAVGGGVAARADRPRVLVNFVASADGHATFQGRSEKLGDEGDRALFHGLRELADAVLAGTGTLRIERYGRLLSRPERRARRIAAGRPPEPVLCVVTRTGAPPLEVPLFAEPEARVLLFVAQEVDLDGVAAQVELIRLSPEELTLTAVLRRLRADHGVELLLCEGGPTMFGSLLREGLLDELFLTVAPRLTGGGTGPGVTSGPELPEPAELATVWLLERGGSLYLRYRLQESSR